MKLLFVIQRYGPEVDGGAELYCRWVAEALANHHDITVLTTTARDYITWENYYSPGEETQGPIRIIRKSVNQSRDIESFNALTDRVLRTRVDLNLQNQWLRAQGPWSPELFSYLSKKHSEYDYILFFTYLYCPTAFGIHIAPEKSILIPTAHDEPVAHLPVFQKVYGQPKGIMYLTGPEKTFVEKTYPVHKIPSLLLGTGIELPASDVSLCSIRKKFNIEKDYLIYIGRVEEGKGCQHLVGNFQKYRQSTQHKISLVLAGRNHMNQADDPAIVFTDFIPDEYLKPLLKGAKAVVVPSAFESLSILLLQAFYCSKPVIANAHSEVLLNHCLSSNGGLFYKDQEEFVHVLDFLLRDKSLRKRLGENGRRYIDDNYTWPKVIEKFDSFVNSL